MSNGNGKCDSCEQQIFADIIEICRDCRLMELQLTRQRAFEDVIKAIETKQWHPGNAKGAINPSSVIALIRSLK